MNVESFGLTVTGRRANNEDALCRAPELGLFAVADGMGGYEGGEIASSLTVDLLRRFVEDNRRDPQGTWPIRERRGRSYSENLLAAATAAAHRAICERRVGPLAMMGSTVVAVLIEGAALVVAHVGDSRVYRLRDGTVSALTRDHSLWAELQAAGAAQDRATFPYKNQITRALGIEDTHDADVATHAVLPGDVYLLCSDGLYDPLAEARLGECLTLAPELATHALVDAALKAGSTDNVTAVVLRVLA